MELGVVQTLTVVKQVDFGVYLADHQEEKDEKVLLPGKQVPAGTKTGDSLQVFLYRDSKDRMIAATTVPKLVRGKVAKLQVLEVGKIGAFLDWGLEKDLLLPFREQTKKLRAGDECLVSLYIDKSNRLCATMKIYEYLEQHSPYQKDDQVQGTVYQISDNFGAFVAVDDRYSALIPKKECYGEIRVGDLISARVTAVKEDGKLDLSVRDKAYRLIEKDAEKILSVIDSFGGALPFNDKANPDVIRRELQMSKNEFKRSVGKLLKDGKIEITEHGIHRKHS